MADGRSALLYLSDILDSIEKIQEYIKEVDAHSFFSNPEKQDAVIRREPVAKIPSETLELYPTVPWRQIKAMRNIAIHHYFGVSPELIWQVAQKDIIELKPVIEKAIKDLG